MGRKTVFLRFETNFGERMLQMVSENNSDSLTPVSFAEFEPTTYEQWKEEAVASLKGAPFEKKLLNKTYEGLTLEPLYTAEHVQAYGQRLGFPGAEDYLRGAAAGGYAAQPWTIAQYADAQLPDEANEILRQELAGGATGVGFCPAAAENIEDLALLLQGVCLKDYALNVFAGPSALPLLALLKAGIVHMGFPVGAQHGAVGADPIGVYARDGALPASLDCYYSQMGAALAWAGQNLPELRTVYIQGQVYQDGGANAVQEVAAAMATAIAYLDALIDQGFTIDQAAKTIRFGFALGANFFMEIAKLRAARMIWSQIVTAYGGSGDAAKINVAATNSRFTMTAYDPYVNVLRATTQAFSGVVGGVDAMEVIPFDAALGESNIQSRRIARNIQVMMQNEFNLLQPIDPAGGSWYVETLTAQLAEAVWAKLQDIDKQGGIVAVLQSGSLQQEISATLADRFKKLATRSDKAVGVNMYANMTEQPLEIPDRAAQIQEQRARRAAAYQAKQAQAKVQAALDALDNSVEGAAAAFTAGAGLAQVADRLNQGQVPDITPIQAHRWTEQFEALRDATRAAAQAGKEIKVFLCNMGPIPQHKARADFSAGFMEVAGFTVLRNDGFPTPEAAIAAAKDSGAAVTIICSTDETYPELVPVLAKGIKESCPAMKVILAGAPAAEFKDSYDQAGVDDYIHIKANCLQILTAIQKERGIC